MGREVVYNRFSEPKELKDIQYATEILVRYREGAYSDGSVIGLRCRLVGRNDRELFVDNLNRFSPRKIYVVEVGSFLGVAPQRERFPTFRRILRGLMS